MLSPDRHCHPVIIFNGCEAEVLRSNLLSHSNQRGVCFEHRLMDEIESTVIGKSITIHTDPYKEIPESVR